MDVAGDQTLDHHQHIAKQRLDLRGRSLGPAAINAEPPAVFGGPGGPGGALGLLLQQMLMGQQQAEQVTNVKEGCNVAGHVEINKVAGNFHFAVGRTMATGVQHVHQFTFQDVQTFNISHHIHSLAFGPPPPPPFPPTPQVLDGVSNILVKGATVAWHTVPLRAAWR